MEKEMIRDYELDIIVKAWRDEAFRQKLMKDPKKAIEDEFELKIPEDVNIYVHEEDDQRIHLIVPSVPSNFDSGDLSDDELKDVIGGVLATGHVSTFPNSRERARLRNLQRENEQQKKMIEKLKDDLNELEKQMLK